MEPAAPGRIAPGLAAVTGLERMPRTRGKAACAAITSSAFSVWNQAWATIAPGNPCRTLISVSQAVSLTWSRRSISASQCTVVMTLCRAASRR
jgi:hypothetical protein